MPNMLRGYFTDMREVLKQIYCALYQKGSCFIVVDQSAYVGVIVPTDTLLAYLAEDIGFTIKQIMICRKAATSGQQLASYPYLGSTLRESIVWLQKEKIKIVIEYFGEISSPDRFCAAEAPRCIFIGLCHRITMRRACRYTRYSPHSCSRADRAGLPFP